MKTGLLIAALLLLATSAYAQFDATVWRTATDESRRACGREVVGKPDRRFRNHGHR
jgi:hypothetical protein